MNMRTLLALCCSCLLSTPLMALDAEGTRQLQHLQQRWAQINYQLPEAQREQAFEALAKEAEQSVRARPDAAELLTWQGIILSTYAGAHGGLGALGIAKQARSSFEQAIALDPQALQGSAYTSLGTLYSQVPGWPVGFGDDEEAERLLTRALQINPNGIDPNYFYADYLLRNDRPEEALRALQKAQAAPDRPGRELADQGRRGEIAVLLEKVRAELD
jgi:tetratricopeptide (TPR) repeat protein